MLPALLRQIIGRITYAFKFARPGFPMCRDMQNNTPETLSRPERLVLTRREACVALGISATSLWRLEARGLIRPVSHLRTKLYPLKELARFLDQAGAGRSATGQLEKGGK